MDLMAKYLGVDLGRIGGTVWHLIVGHRSQQEYFFLF